MYKVQAKQRREEAKARRKVELAVGPVAAAHRIDKCVGLPTSKPPFDRRVIVSASVVVTIVLPMAVFTLNCRWGCGRCPWGRWGMSFLVRKAVDAKANSSGQSNANLNCKLGRKERGRTVGPWLLCRVYKRGSPCPCRSPLCTRGTSARPATRSTAHIAGWARKKARH